LVKKNIIYNISPPPKNEKKINKPIRQKKNKKLKNIPSKEFFFSFFLAFYSGQPFWRAHSKHLRLA